MHVKDIMTKDPACCDKDASVQDAAKLMVGNDCGEIPVVDGEGGLVGVVTDRDICCRVVAEGKSPDTPVGDIMTRSVVTVTPDQGSRAKRTAGELADLLAQLRATHF